MKLVIRSVVLSLLTFSFFFFSSFILSLISNLTSLISELIESLPLKENTQIRLDNGQNKIIVWGIHFLRLSKRIFKVIKELKK